MEHRDLQRRIERCLDKRSGVTFAPPAGKRMIYFIDDMNLPEMEAFGTQNSLSLLRMVMDTVVYVVVLACVVALMLVVVVVAVSSLPLLSPSRRPK